MMQEKVAGIFLTKEEASKFVQNLPSEMYANCNFSVNQDLLSVLKKKRLNISENEQVILIEVT